MNTMNHTTNNSVKQNTNGKICHDFMYNKCNRTVCKFEHDITICFDFWNTGSCNNSCNKKHISKFGRPERSELPIQQRNKPKKDKSKYNKNKEQKQKKNTVVFEPMDHKLVDARIVFSLNNTKLDVDLTSRDILLVPNLFRDFKKSEIYDLLVNEIENCGIPSENLLKLWHGNDKIEGTHLIANDRTKWKEKCPTFNMVIERLQKFFDMDIKATRLNWYKDTSHWKPFHFDASAVKADKALVQNFTVAVSFGATRDCAFEKDDSCKNVISFPIGDGEIYCFAQNTNCTWRHGVLQETPVQQIGRISIICWGSVPNIN